MKRSTWILLLVLALALGAYFYLKNRPKASSDITPTETPRVLLFKYGEEAGDITSIRIQNAEGKYVLLVRDQNDQWAIKAPIAGAADQSKMEMADTQIHALGINAFLETEPDLEAIGLKTPAYTFEIRSSNGNVDIMEVGNVAPSGSGYYVRLNGKIYIVAQYNMDALTILLESPPYLATLTPTEAPTETPAATSTEIPTATDTPAPESTPVTPTP
jgi:hypothetical protein